MTNILNQIIDIINVLKDPAEDGDVVGREGRRVRGVEVADDRPIPPVHQVGRVYLHPSGSYSLSVILPAPNSRTVVPGGISFAICAVRESQSGDKERESADLR